MASMNALVKRGPTVALCRVPIPTPAAYEVRVRVALAGVCRTDVQVARGLIPCADPLVLGHEFAGTIDAMGSNVWSVRPGQRVAVQPVIGCGSCSICKRANTINCPKRTMLGVEHHGAFAEYVCVPATCVVPIPEQLPWNAAAYAEPVAAALAVLEAGIPSRASVLILGANRFADLVLRLLRQEWIHDAILFDDSSGAEPAEDQYDVVIETGLRAETLPRMIRAVRPGGMLILKSRQPVAVPFEPLLAIRKQVTIRAVNYGSFYKAVSLLGQGRLDVEGLLGPAYPLEAYEEVFARDESNESAKLFFDPAGEHVRHRR